MSFTFQHGFIWKNPGGIEVLLGAIGAITPRLSLACEDAVAKQYACASARYLDRCIVGMDPDPEGFFLPVNTDGRNLFSRLHGKAEQERRNQFAKGSRCPAHDWECRIGIYLLTDEKPLVALFSEKASIYSPVIGSVAGMSDFMCWTSSDRPEEVPEAEWSARKALWYRAAVPGGLVTGTPLCITPVDSCGLVPSREAITDAQPGHLDRVHSIALEKLRSEWISRDLGGAPDTFKYSEYIRSYFRFCDWSLTPEGVEALAISMPIVGERLPHRYLEHDFVDPKGAADCFGTICRLKGGPAQSSG
jgi:hypothetical protein